MSDVDEVADFEIEDDLEVIESEEVPAEENEEAKPESGDEDEANKRIKVKRTVRNPQPKLNAETLKGKRGLTALESYFERVKFKGRGYEEQDLGVVLKTYEYWCHRLFPKYPFDQCIEKIEKLGNKKPVVTHIKRIRLNMLLDDIPSSSNALGAEPDSSDEEYNNLPETSQVPPVLSEEQLEMIRLNKERAERIRREKLQRVTQDDSSQIEDIIYETNPAESVSASLESQPTESDVNGEETVTAENSNREEPPEDANLEEEEAMGGSDTSDV